MFYGSNPLTPTLSPLGRGEGVVSIWCGYKDAMLLTFWLDNYPLLPHNQLINSCNVGVTQNKTN